mmetsp:Transcript_21930/g.34355  ORF Transcript_21930/g.34355 Transcript_21930/m.34355 type:complete len:91 (-) Transcript_21930:294-566(-)
MEPMWALKTSEGLQRIVPRLNDSAPGWRVERQEVDAFGHLHWCVYLDQDATVTFSEPDSGIKKLERQLGGFLSDLGSHNIMETLDVSVVS